MNPTSELLLLSEAHCEQRLREADEYRRAAFCCDPLLADLWRLTPAAIALAALAVGSWLFPF